MATKIVTEKQILKELRDLEPERWFEVLDFIGFLKYRASLSQTGPHSRVLTARELLESDLVGLWADRTDIGDSLMYARQLRRQAEHRQGTSHDPA